MSMTREEAIATLQEKYDYCKSFYDLAAYPEISYPGTAKYMQALQVALTALRPVSREQVEKAWRGECDCSKLKACCTCCSMRCQYCIGQSEYKQAAFCMKCGRPLTDEAVEMVMRRLEVPYEIRD
mgnify:CR=1 FL=1